jgi:hypothetical protein
MELAGLEPATSWVRFAPVGARSLKRRVCRDFLGCGRTRPIPSEPRALPLLPRPHAPNVCVPDPDPEITDRRPRDSWSIDFAARYRGSSAR